MIYTIFLDGPAVLGEMVMLRLTEEPRMASVTATNRVKVKIKHHIIVVNLGKAPASRLNEGIIVVHSGKARQADLDGVN